jgi:hypothetical protein
MNKIADGLQRPDNAPALIDPSLPRYLTSYMARRSYAEKVQRPPAVFGVEDTIDIHCHAHEGQQDPLAVAQLASASGMKGLLYKSLAGEGNGMTGPASMVRQMKDELARWCDENKHRPIEMWAGHCIARREKPPTAAATRRQLDDGVAALWMPIAMHANTLSKVGGKPLWWGKSTNPRENTPPFSWEEALKIGHYLLDERGHLKAEIREIFRLVADYDVAVFFGHATHPEIFAMAEEVQKLGIRRAVVDHPFSPFVDLSLAQMRELIAAGITMNFTYDEISPLLGVDPALMCRTIQSLDMNYVTLSSDAGEPLFPNSVECMRLIMGHMRAFGLTDDQIRQLSFTNPARIVKLQA